MRIYILLSVFIGLQSSPVLAQSNNKEWQVGYFAPYISNMGGTVGFALDLKELGDNSTEQRKSKQRLQLLAQLGYFTQTNVSHHLLLNPELVYRWNKSDKRFFLTSSVGAGYLLAFQRQEGSLNLGTGEIDYRYDAKVKETGKTYNAQVAHLWALNEEGKIISFQQYADTKKLADAEK